MKKKKECPNKLLTILMVVCVVLSVVILGIVSYDKFLKKKEKEEIKPATCNCPVCQNVDLGEKVGSVKEITLTDKNQEIKIGNKVYKVRIGTDNNSGNLSVDDNFVSAAFFGGNHVYVDHAYLTDKFMFITQVGQFDETIVYVIGENGEVIFNGNNCQMRDFKIIDNHLHATGGKAYYDGRDLILDGHDLLIKYIDNTLIVTEAK